ncbi:MULTISPECIES: KAP family P-loop NTPase fold protein [Aminobacter]|uniref:KAP family P-loop NTPase fold protein n=1 Tax=Aminobacter TaxID=31988 RepID=UPI0024556551|nr:MULTISPECIES: P-loop NTPase fold protein [Aminobacter]MDH4986925.1 P-loop NTPase fold protein [Aminobacter anthyllidis]CAI2931872.1 KAP NTPase domain-containing protein [Aminobacter niigataensis]
MGTEIWAGDHLKREDDANFLIDYLLERNAQAVETGLRGTSINVSAPWGAGKTFFMTRLARQLGSHEFRVAEVNAWRDDHADDPIFPVMSAMLRALNKTGKKAEIRQSLKKNAGKIAVRAGLGLAKRGAAFIIGKEAVDGITDEVAKSIAEAAEQTMSEYAEQALERFEEGQKAIDDFRTELAKEVEGDTPLFVLIDEVDRCRPTYAISLLERIKHLFDVPNVIFLVATHTDQLAHTIRAVYGAGFDADTYLHRFFDRTYSFDQPTLNQFVDVQWAELGLQEDRYLPIPDHTQRKMVSAISRMVGLSLRDIKQCMGMLSSVTNRAETKVPVPLLYVYPLIAAYHLRKTGAFNIATGTTNRNTDQQIATREFQSLFSGEPLFIFQNRSHFGRQQIGEQTVELSRVLETFMGLLSTGLTEQIGGEAWESRFVEDYRQAEFAILHGSTHSGRKVASILELYRAMIQKAGRIGQLT